MELANSRRRVSVSSASGWDSAGAVEGISAYGLSKRSSLHSFDSVRLGDLGWLLVFNLLVFQSFLGGSNELNIEIFTYNDEFALVLCTLCALLTSATRGHERRLVKRERIALIFIVVLIGWTVLCNIHVGVQTAIGAIGTDIVACFKYPVTLLSCYVIFREREGLLSLMLGEVKLLVLVMFTCAMINIFVDIGMASDPRYGLRAFMFVLSHPTMVCAVMAGCCVLLCTDVKANRPWIYLALVVTCLTLRSKGIAFAAVAFCVVWFIGRGGHITLAHVVVLGGTAICLGWSQFAYYYVETEGAARSELLTTAFEIANDYFPFGTGFATYGSAVTANAQYYSQLYYDYGLYTVYGISPGDSSFLSDTFWPIPIVQFGWLGAVLYFGILTLLITSACKRAGHDYLLAAPVLSFAYLLISSTAESAFFHPMAVLQALCLALALASKGGVRHENAQDAGILNREPQQTHRGLSRNPGYPSNRAVETLKHHA